MVHRRAWELCLPIPPVSVDHCHQLATTTAAWKAEVARETARAGGRILGPGCTALSGRAEWSPIPLALEALAAPQRLLSQMRWPFSLLWPHLGGGAPLPRGPHSWAALLLVATPSGTGGGARVFPRNLLRTTCCLDPLSPVSDPIWDAVRQCSDVRICVERGSGSHTWGGVQV